MKVQCLHQMFLHHVWVKEFYSTFKGLYMNITFTSRHFKASQELQDLATKSVEHFEKMYSSIKRTEIILDEEHEKVVEFIVHVNHHILSSKDHSYSFEQSIHAASDKMIAQLRKLKEKQSDSRKE